MILRQCVERSNLFAPCLETCLCRSSHLNPTVRSHLTGSSPDIVFSRSASAEAIGSPTPGLTAPKKVTASPRSTERQYLRESCKKSGPLLVISMLSSGPTEFVADGENLARFLPQSSQFNSQMAKPAAFLPNPKSRNTSVFRYGNDPERLLRLWNETATAGRALKGAAVFMASHVRKSQLDAIAAEPPPAHANIEGWPWMENDPELQKARQLELASQIASTAELVRL